MSTGHLHRERADKTDCFVRPLQNQEIPAFSALCLLDFWVALVMR